MSEPKSLRTLRFDAFATRMDRLYSAADRRGISRAKLVLPAEGMVDRGPGPSLHYLEWPTPVRSPALLMLHGGGLHAHTFDLLGNLLRDRARCLALDLRGHGDSHWADPRRYGSEAIADDIDAVVAALELENVVVVGHSMGGLGAMAWAARRHPALAGLMVLDVAPTMRSDSTGSLHAFVAADPTFADLEEADGYGAQGGSVSAANGDAMAANLRWNEDGLLAFKYDAGQFAAIELTLGDELRALAGQIDCPAVVLRGQRSKVIGADAAADLAALLPQGTWAEVPNAGHTIQSSNPVGLAEKITDFLGVLEVSVP